MAGYRVVGRSTPLIDAAEKSQGAARYTFDTILPRMLYGRILRSPHPHAHILNIDTSKAQKLPGVKAVAAGKDTPGVKYGLFKGTRDESVLAVDKTRYVGDEIAAVAAVDEDTAEEALGLIVVEYETLPAVFDPEEAMKPQAPQIHDHSQGNISVHVSMVFGEVEAAFREADLVREDRFETEALAHCQLEPYGVVASYEAGQLNLWIPNQSPFIKRKAISSALRVPLDRIRVHMSHIGGAFGSQSDMLKAEAVAALLAMKAERPVRLTLSREETFTCTRQKHPFIIYLRTGVKRDGTLLGRSYRVIADGGAYGSTGAIAISNPPIMTLAAYRMRGYAYEAYRVYTNKPTRGAMRGHGNQQMRFAEETQLDMIAKDLGIDPVDMRLRNAVQPGDILLNKSRVTSCGFSETISSSVERSRWKEKVGRLPPNRGIGIACSPYICGFSYGIRTSSAAFIKFNEDGQATVFTGIVDNGQGNRTMMAQVVAEELGIPLQAVTVVNGDTETTPLDPGTHSMSATTTSANAVKVAAGDARKQLLTIASEHMEANATDLEVGEGRVYVRGSPERSMPIQAVVWAGLRQGRPILGKGFFMPPVDPLDWVGGGVQGQMTSAYTFGTAIAEVEVDPDTGQVSVERVIGAHDCGLAINPLAVEASMQGSLMFGQGQALSEELSWEGGQLLNPNFADYGLSSALESPHVESIIVETSEPNGPYGAKGAAETLNIAIIPAIANAIYDAVGIRVMSLPITPEKILKALGEKRGKREDVVHMLNSSRFRDV